MANPLDPLLRVIANEYIDDNDLHRFTGLLFQVTHACASQCFWRMSEEMSERWWRPKGWIASA
jgi:hypothetical protein